MEIEREITIYPSSEKKKILILVTDTDNIILSKIKVAVNESKPIFIFLPKNFSMSKFKNDKNYVPEILNFERLPIIQKLQDDNVEMNLELLNEIPKRFSISKHAQGGTTRLLEYIIFRILLTYPYFSKKEAKKAPSRLPSTIKNKMEKKSKREKEEREKEYERAIQAENAERRKMVDEKNFIPHGVLITREEREKFLKSIYIVAHRPLYVQNIPIITKFITKSSLRNYCRLDDFRTLNNTITHLYDENIRMTQANQSNLQASVKAHTYFDIFEPKASSDIQFQGRVFNVNIQTKQYTTGILFDNLRLNKYIPIAHYKTFFKIFDGYSADISPKKDDNLYIYRKEDNGENVQIFCQNTDKGITLQVLLLSNSLLDTLESVYDFLNIDRELIESTRATQVGILGEFEFLDSSFHSPFLSDMILNGKTFITDEVSISFFSIFLLVNDSDKISKENNSVYIYFKQLGSRNVDKNIIHVGGWNKETSRFGDLTATLTPLKKDDKYFVNVKIHRVYHEKTIDEFKIIMGKLLALYETMERGVLQKYNTYFENQEYYRINRNEIDVQLPSVQILLKPISEIKVSSKIGSLGYENKMLFPGEYVRVCQPLERKPILFKNESDVDTLNLEEDEKNKRVLLYPKVEKTFKHSILKPNYYYCKNDDYPYIGYVEIKKKSEEHPYSGFAPCCFKTSREKSNKKIQKFLYESTLFEKESKMTGYKIKKNKVIEHTGQLGELPIPVKKFFTSLDPRLNFVRIGIKNEFATSSLLYCCDFEMHYEKDVNIELQTNLRSEILKESKGRHPIQLIAQENVLYGLDFIQDVLENDRNFINVRHVFRLVQDFFHVNLIVLTINGDIVRPNSYFNYKALLYEKERFMILLEHDNPKRYELIGVEKDQTLEFCSFSRRLHFYPQLEFIYRESLQIKENNKIFPLVSSVQYNLWRQLKDTKIDSQILSKTGQCIALLLRYKNDFISVYFNESLPPFDVNQKQEIYLPHYHEVESFLKNVFFPQKIEIVKINSLYSYFSINDNFCFPFRSDESVSFQKEETFHNFLLLTKPSTKTIQRFTNFLNCYTLLNIMKDYLLLMLGKFIEEDPQNQQEYQKQQYGSIIENFKNSSLTFVKGKDYKVEENSISCLKNGNMWMFTNDRRMRKLILPEEIKDIMNYFLLWNLENNKEYLQNWKSNQELNYFHFTNQFNSILHNDIQLSSKGELNVNYNPYYDFDVTQNTDFAFEAQTLYYHYDKENSEIQPFFILHRKNLTDDDFNYIVSVMDWYYTEKVFSFHPDRYVHQTNFRNKFRIYSFPKDETNVNTFSNLRHVKKKKTNGIRREEFSSDDETSQDSEVKIKAPKRRRHFTMVLFEFL